MGSNVLGIEFLAEDEREVRVDMEGGGRRVDSFARTPQSASAMVKEYI